MYLLIHAAILLAMCIEQFSFVDYCNIASRLIEMNTKESATCCRVIHLLPSHCQ